MGAVCHHSIKRFKVWRRQPDGIAVLARHTVSTRCLLTIRPRNAEEMLRVAVRRPRGGKISP
jgi:hypothetical protein